MAQRRKRGFRPTVAVERYLATVENAGESVTSAINDALEIAISARLWLGKDWRKVRDLAEDAEAQPGQMLAMLATDAIVALERAGLKGAKR